MPGPRMPAIRRSARFRQPAGPGIERRCARACGFDRAISLPMGRYMARMWKPGHLRAPPARAEAGPPPSDPRISCHGASGSFRPPDTGRILARIVSAAVCRIPPAAPEVSAQSSDCQLASFSHIKLPEYILEVVFYSHLGDEQPRCDLLVGQPADGQSRNLPLARSQSKARKL